VTAQPAPAGRATRLPVSSVPGWARANGWVLGLMVFLIVLLAFTRLINPFYDLSSLQGLATSVLPLALAALAQTVVVIAGGIDLSISSQMALTSCIAAVLMQAYPGDATAVAIVIAVLLVGVLLGAVNGGLIVLTGVPDIIVTLSTSFIFAGFALLVTPRPAGAAAGWLKDLVVGPLATFPLLVVIPKAFIVLIVIAALIWVPLHRSRLGLSLYAVGSNRLAAFRSGVDVRRTKFLSYIFAGLFGAFAGLSLTASTGIGSPVPGPDYVLLAIGAVVLGGVSLAGGVGGMVGPVLAVLVLQLIRNDMTFLNVDPNYGLVAQGFLVIAVLVVGSFVQIRRRRT
jgi:ribose transport system permease protein